MRVGELLTLTPADIDFEKQTVIISKTFHRSKGRDIITSPKTKKSNRTIKIPPFLCEEMQDYITRRLLCRDVVVQGNPRVYKALKNQMTAIYEELKGMESISPDNDELLYTLRVIANTLDGLKGEDE